MRTVSKDPFAQRPLHSPGLLRKPSAGVGSMGLQLRFLRRRLPLVPLPLLRTGLQPLLLLARLARCRRGTRVWLLLPSPLVAQTASEVG